MRHCIGLVAGCWLAAVIPLAAQEAPQRAVSDAGAGLYFGTRPSLNGPMFYARRWLPLPRSGGHMFAGGRFEYRDDDNSRGRAVSAGLGLEAAPTVGSGGFRDAQRVAGVEKRDDVRVSQAGCDFDFA